MRALAAIALGSNLESRFGDREANLREAVRRMRVSHRDTLLGPITVSVGIAAFPVHGSDGPSLLKAADIALYEAKKAGRDRVMLASPPEPWPVAP